jgi:uncharacterized protein DUF4382
MNSPRHSIAVLVPTLLLACGGQGTGRISVLLTDAPADFKAAVVTITEIDLVGSGGTTVLSNTKVTTNLLTLANDTAQLVDSAVVPSGTYTQLRFVITGGYVEVVQPDGSSIIYASSPDYEGLPEGAVVGGTLRMPSYAESGLKVDLGNLTVGTDSKVVLVDFDVSQSFGHVAGASGAWVMHPVMTATELQFSGTLDVTLKLGAGVTLPTGVTLGQFNAVLTNSGGSAKTLALTDMGGGVFGASFKFLIPGSYTLNFTAPGTLTFTTSPAIPASVTVASGQETAADFVVTSAH